MAFYIDNRDGMPIFSEHEFPANGIMYPRHMRGFMDDAAQLRGLASDLPNMYGDMYEHDMAMYAQQAAQGLPVKVDPLWKQDLFKDVRAARDRGDRSDRSMWPDLGYGGHAVDVFGNLRSVEHNSDVTLWPHCPAPLFDTSGVPGPWATPQTTVYPGDTVHCGYPWLMQNFGIGQPLFHPY